MNEGPKWIGPALSVIFSITGSVAGSYIAVQVSIARLQEQMISVERDVRDLQVWRDKHEEITQRGLSDLAKLEERSRKK